MKKVFLILALVAASPVTGMAGSHHHHHRERSTDGAKDRSFIDWFCMPSPGSVCHDRPSSSGRVRLHTGSEIQSDAFASTGPVSPMHRKLAPRHHLQSSAVLAERSLARKGVGPVERLQRPSEIRPVSATPADRLTPDDGRRLADYLLPINRINDAFLALEAQ